GWLYANLKQPEQDGFRQVIRHQPSPKMTEKRETALQQPGYNRLVAVSCSTYTIDTISIPKND
ncbi:MAG: hypothetical protein KDI43_16850, partial [Gammaproteobacteria bacterium]|nr:hypothetical protein [Gammaproteobacteria bacterium]